MMSGSARRAPLESPMLVENKYFVIAAVILFLAAVVLTGTLWAGFGMLALVAGIGWAVRRLRS